MSVSFAKAYAVEMRRHGVRVVFHPRWETAGNGQSSDYRGSVTHHTGVDFDAGFRALVEGRSDLSGPLCNSAGWADGHITIVSAHPANHAGASGGYNTAPLPVTRNFNRLVWGHEIMYPGTEPMTDAQYRTAQISAGVVNKLLGRSRAYAKGHAETSITGKWDPGYASGKTINMHTFRAGIADAMNQGVENDMQLSDKINLKGELAGQALGTDSMSVDGALGYGALAKKAWEEVLETQKRLSAAEQRLQERIAKTEERIQAEHAAMRETLASVVREALADAAVSVNINVPAEGPQS